MPCYSPLEAYKTVDGRVVFTDKDRGGSAVKLSLACGQCTGCRISRSRHWALRCVHEAQMHERNSFITLTYDDVHLPKDGSVDVRHWQTFAKRLRKKIGPFRFFHCGEYGEKSQRPHYHACVFGEDFASDRVFWKRDAGNDLFVSKVLTETWGKGFTTVGNLTYESAAYVARYIMKKASGPYAKAARYGRLDWTTGEYWEVRPEYITMSRRPGVGKTWFDKFMDDVYPEDEVVHDGRKFRPPRYYDKLLDAMDSFPSEPGAGEARRAGKELLEDLKLARACRISGNDDYSPARLAVRERVSLAKLARFERKL